MNPSTNPHPNQIELEEGMHIVLVHGRRFSPYALFMMTAWSSAMLGGKPVYIGGFLPGVSLLIHVLHHDVASFAERSGPLWAQVQHHLDEWIEIAAQFPCKIFSVDGMDVTLGLDRLATLNKGVVQYEVEPLGSPKSHASARPA